VWERLWPWLFLDGVKCIASYGNIMGKITLTVGCETFKNKQEQKCLTLPEFTLFLEGFMLLNI
jgi:hypothetical protein